MFDHEDEEEDDFFHLLELIDQFKKIQDQGQVPFYDLEEFEAIADFYFDMGKLNQALEVTDMALEQHPYSDAVRLQKVRFLTAANKTREAGRLLSELENGSSDREEILMARAALFSKMGQHQKAIQLYRNTLQKSEFPEELHQYLAMEYQLTGNYAQAIKYLKMSLEEWPEDEIAIYNLALCYDLLERWQEGAAFLEKLIDQVPYNEVAWYHLGMLQAKLGNDEQALRAFDYAVLIDDFFSAAYYEKAAVLERMYRFEEAAEAYYSTFEFDGPNGYAYFRIAQCHLRLNQLDKAQILLSKALQDDPDLEEAHYELALLLDDKEQWPEAIHNIKKALELDPDNLTFSHAAARIFRRAGLLDEAVEIYEEMMSEGLDFPQAYIDFAELLFDMCEFDRGMEQLYRGVNDYPNSDLLLYRLAGYLYLMNESDEGLIYFKKAYALNPSGRILFFELYPALRSHHSLLAYQRKST